MLSTTVSTCYSRPTPPDPTRPPTQSDQHHHGWPGVTSLAGHRSTSADNTPPVLLVRGRPGGHRLSIIATLATRVRMAVYAARNVPSERKPLSRSRIRPLLSRDIFRLSSSAYSTKPLKPVNSCLSVCLCVNLGGPNHNCYMCRLVIMHVDPHTHTPWTNRRNSPANFLVKNYPPQKISKQGHLDISLDIPKIPAPGIFL